MSYRQEDTLTVSFWCLKGTEFPVLEELKNSINISVSPPLLAYACLLPPFPARQKDPNLYLYSLPETHSDTKEKKECKAYPIGYFHVDIAEVSSKEGKLYLLVAIDRTSKFACVELLEKYGKAEAGQFLPNLIEVVPYKIHTILTDNGIQFTNRKVDKHAWSQTFDWICDENRIEHRLTKVNHPWTNEQVERMHRTLKDATVKRYYYTSHQQIRQHLYAFVNVYNFAKRLKSLKGLTPYEFIIKSWKSEPKKFKVNPNHHNMELNIYLR